MWREGRAGRGVGGRERSGVPREESGAARGVGGRLSSPSPPRSRPSWGVVPGVAHPPEAGGPHSPRSEPQTPGLGNSVPDTPGLPVPSLHMSHPDPPQKLLEPLTTGVTGLTISLLTPEQAAASLPSPALLAANDCVWPLSPPTGT